MILGGGVAGASAAIALLRNNLTAALVEKSDYSSFRIGETVSVAIKRSLQNLGVDACMLDEHLPSHANESIWGSPRPEENNFFYNSAGHGWHLDRQTFDRKLASHAEKVGAKIFRNATIESITFDDAQGWILHFQVDGHQNMITASFVIDATGRNAILVKRQGGKRNAQDNLIALTLVQEQAPKKSARSNYTSIEAVENGWWYCADLPDGKLVVSYFTDADTYKRHASARPNYLNGMLSETLLINERAHADSSSFRILPANSYLMSVLSGPNWLAIGDAAMAYDPLSSSGIVRALNDGSRAAGTIASVLAGQKGAMDTFASVHRSKYYGYLSKRRDYYSIETRWPDSLFWNRRRIEVAR